MNDEKLILTIEVPQQDHFAWGGNCEIIAKVPKYKKWWHFWEDNWEEKPCRIVDMGTYIKKIS
jgi:hypothetical protein